ncbi:unnamed protein product [Eruca vesicaria subsp. sativa]|uniref:Oleosin n=1 Tax=Eruca vesicaria subsp. sativa TaxID=29727 RepID=A0ABC8K701_ERUVS|nr:unnamed protein product [Eruca vesicaria subsp. sativa]
MILTGLALAGTAVVLMVMTPVFVVLSPILVTAVITSSFLVTGFLASGRLGASVIALFVWLYKELIKKQDQYSRSIMHARFRPNEDKSSKPSRGDKPPEEVRPPERNKTAEEIKPSGRDKAEEYKLSEKDKLSEGDHNLAEGDISLGEVIKHVEERPLIPEISKVLLMEQNSIGSNRCDPGTLKRSHRLRFAMDSAKVQSIFMKEYQKVPRVGALAYKYLTSRDKNYINHFHIGHLSKQL